MKKKDVLTCATTWVSTVLSERSQTKVTYCVTPHVRDVQSGPTAGAGGGSPGAAPGWRRTGAAPRGQVSLWTPRGVLEPGGGGAPTTP